MQAGSRVLAMHAKLAGHTTEQSEAELHHQYDRATIEYPRPTVWREMAALERSTYGPDLEVVEGRGPRTTAMKAHEHTRRTAIGIGALVVFGGLLSVDIFGDDSKNACFALLVFLSILWATEVIPLYVTSMLVPALTVILRILPEEEGCKIQASCAAKRVFAVRAPSAFCFPCCAGFEPPLARVQALHSCVLCMASLHDSPTVMSMPV
jgi:phosphate transporter